MSIDADTVTAWAGLALVYNENEQACVQVSSSVLVAKVSCAGAPRRAAPQRRLVYATALQGDIAARRRRGGAERRGPGALRQSRPRPGTRGEAARPEAGQVSHPSGRRNRVRKPGVKTGWKKHRVAPPGAGRLRAAAAVLQAPESLLLVPARARSRLLGTGCTGVSGPERNSLRNELA